MVDGKTFHGLLFSALVLFTVEEMPHIQGSVCVYEHSHVKLLASFQTCSLTVVEAFNTTNNLSSPTGDYTLSLTCEGTITCFCVFSNLFFCIFFITLFK